MHAFLTRHGLNKNKCYYMFFSDNVILNIQHRQDVITNTLVVPVETHNLINRKSCYNIKEIVNFI